MDSQNFDGRTPMLPLNIQEMINNDNLDELIRPKPVNTSPCFCEKIREEALLEGNAYPKPCLWCKMESSGIFYVAADGRCSNNLYRLT